MKKLHPFEIGARGEDAALKLENATAMKRIDSTHSQVRIEKTASAPRRSTSSPEKPVFMHSLYYVLTDQHREEFAPVRGNQQTVSRLVRYFEDIVIESKLSALVIEARCLNGDPARETQRLAKLVAASRRVYLFSGNSECTARTWAPQPSLKLSNVEEGDHHSIETGPFILVMEPRFCGLFASSIVPDERNSHTTAYEMVWTFDPNVVFTAVEYLMGRMNAQRPEGFRHRLGWPLRQYSQWPQKTDRQAMTWSPGLTYSTSSPVISTTPRRFVAKHRRPTTGRGPRCDAGRCDRRRWPLCGPEPRVVPTAYRSAHPQSSGSPAA